MTSYEALYERPCRSSVYWIEVGEKISIDPYLVRDAYENVDLIRKRLLTSQSLTKDLHQQKAVTSRV